MKSIAEKPLRYKVRTLVAALPIQDAIRIRKRVCAAADISESSYSRYMNERHGTPSNVPATVLKAWATCLNVEMEDLFNPETEA